MSVFFQTKKTLSFYFPLKLKIKNMAFFFVEISYNEVIKDVNYLLIDWINDFINKLNFWI
jgi:hypothetical protein